MIIFGTRGVRSHRERGVFFCPNCQMRRSYELIEPRRYFHLFFIPLIPLDSYDPYVECDSCHGTYRPQVLEYDPERQRKNLMEDFNRALLHSMCLVAAADTVPSTSEAATIKHLYADIANYTVTEDQVLYLISVAEQGAQKLFQDFSRLSSQLSDQAKEALIHVNFLVAFSDGAATSAEVEKIAAYAQALGMSHAHFQGVFGEVQRQLTGN